jgi:hypothetical protein
MRRTSGIGAGPYEVRSEVEAPVALISWISVNSFSLSGGDFKSNDEANQMRADQHADCISL